MSKQAAQAHGLMGAGFYIAISARAKEHGRFAGLNYPVAVLLVLLRRPFKFGNMGCELIDLRVVCHTIFSR